MFPTVNETKSYSITVNIRVISVVPWESNIREFKIFHTSYIHGLNCLY